jgi:DNA-binding transcriptional ArsR family regulator
MEDLEIADIAALVADGSRARVLLALMDGRALPSGELAVIAGISPATMSAHLAKLVNGRLLKVESQGRHRYYRLAGPKVASLLESFSTLAPLPVSPPRARTGPAGAIRFARACYQHLAGHLAVAFNLAAQKQGLWVPSGQKEYAVTAAGADWLAALGIEISGASRKRGFARACLDWSERRHHVSGVLGAFLFNRFLELKWVARTPGSRAVRLTLEGRARFASLLGLEFPRPD